MFERIQYQCLVHTQDDRKSLRHCIVEELKSKKLRINERSEGIILCNVLATVYMYVSFNYKNL